MHHSPRTIHDLFAAHHSPLTTHRSVSASRIAFVLGTRPEAIKLAPVILEAAAGRSRLEPVIISTGQQRDLVGPALAAFNLAADHDLGVMRPEQSLGELAGRCLSGLTRTLAAIRPRLVVVQGDTTSALAGAMAAFYAQIPVAHVEAGLRTGDLAAPFPEEANRQMISRLARLHFAPTTGAKLNLLREGIEPNWITVTGNTVVDALDLLKDRIGAIESPVRVSPDRRLVLVTAHRRENLGRPLAAICSAVCRLAALRRELQFAFVTHPNPAAARIAHQRLSGRDGITLLPPQPYLELLRLVSDAWLILTDSGGLQEEAPSFGQPVLVLRKHTERAEGIEAGIARVVGTSPSRIVREVVLLLDSPGAYQRLLPTDNPYGDGQAAKRIVRAICKFVARLHVDCAA